MSAGGPQGAATDMVPSSSNRVDAPYEQENQK